jgi:hypothetical protein
MPEPELDILDLLRILAQNNVDFIVIGGVAAVLHGAPVATFDLDIVHARSEENIGHLAEALRSLGAFYREHPHTRPSPVADLLAGPGHHLLMTRAGALDLLGEVAGGESFGDLMPQSNMIELEPGLSVRILSLAALIGLKERLGRDKDRATLAILRRTLEEQG